MGSGYGVRQSSRSVNAAWLRMLVAAAAVAASSCAQSHDNAAQIETGENELALLLRDDTLPSEMTPPPEKMAPPPSVLPPRFCGPGPVFPGGPVTTPTTGIAGAPAMSADGGMPADAPLPPTAADAGAGSAAADGGAPVIIPPLRSGPDP